MPAKYLGVQLATHIPPPAQNIISVVLLFTALRLLRAHEVTVFGGRSRRRGKT